MAYGTATATVEAASGLFMLKTVLASLSVLQERATRTAGVKCDLKVLYLQRS